MKKLVLCYDDKPLITYHGGLFHNDIYKQAFINSLNDYKVIEPSRDALYGAYYYIKNSLISGFVNEIFITSDVDTLGYLEDNYIKTFILN